MAKRDPQARAVLRAEDATMLRHPRSILFDHVGCRAIEDWSNAMLDSPAAQAVRDLLRERGVRRHYGRVRVRPARDNGHAWFDNGTLVLPPWSRNKLVVCHELSHAMLEWCDGIEDHGPLFCGTMLVLVRASITAKVGATLARCFVHEGVSVESPA